MIAPGSARPVGAEGAAATSSTTWCCWPRSGRPGRRGAARCRPAASRSRPTWTLASGGPGCWWSRPSSACRRPCALALLGRTSRWKAGGQGHPAGPWPPSSATLPQPAADPATGQAPPPAPAARTVSTTGLPSQTGAVEPGPAAADTLAAALVAGAPAAIVAVDADRRIREFNPSAEALFGRRRAETLGLDMPETLVPERYRQPFVDAMAGDLATGDRSGFSRRVRLRALRADGTERAVELTPMPVTVGGRHLLLRLPARRLRARGERPGRVAEGEARFRLLSEIAPVGIVQSDPEGREGSSTTSGTEMSGIPAEEAIGQSWRSTIHPGDVAADRLWLRDTSGVATELAADCRLRTVSGGENWVHVEVRRITDSDGELVGRVTALTDVNDRMLMEEAVGARPAPAVGAERRAAQPQRRAGALPGHGQPRAAHAADLHRVLRRADQVREQ